MNTANILITVLIGSCGMLAQGLLIRELVVTFLGNELSLGIILGNWILSEAIGVAIFGRFCDRFKDIRISLVLLNFIFAAAMVGSVFLARSWKLLLGLGAGQSIDFGTVIWSSFLTVLIPAASHGALFSGIVVLLGQVGKNPARTHEEISAVYFWETFGTMAGGFVLTYVFFRYLSAFRGAYAVAAAGIVAGAFFMRSVADRMLRFMLLLSLGLLCLISMQLSADYLEKSSSALQYPVGEVVADSYSVYGRLVVVQRQGQRTFFSNGVPVMTAGSPDLDFIQQYAGFCILSHPRPRSLLVVSCAAAGLLGEFMRYPLETIDYAEIDPSLIAAARQWAADYTAREFSDPRLSLHLTDPRSLLRASPKTYDLVVLGCGRPATLSMNRLFTGEFFAAVRKRLNPGGQLCLWLPGSLTYTSKSLREESGSVLRAVQEQFPYSRLIPGHTVFLIASASSAVASLDENTMLQRLQQYDYRPSLFTERFLSYRLDRRWMQRTLFSLDDASKVSNRDMQPVAVLAAIRTWNQETCPWAGRILEYLAGIPAGVFLGMFLAGFFLLGMILRRRCPDFSFSLFSTGFTGMALTVVLLLAYQIAYGYFYYHLGMLIACFMAGTITGTVAVRWMRRRGIFHPAQVMAGEIAQIGFSVILAFIFSYGPVADMLGKPVFVFLFLACGFLVGAQFCLVSFSGTPAVPSGRPAGFFSSVLYSSDLLGGWIAGLLVSPFMLPAAGAVATLLTVAALKTLSFFVETVRRK